MQQVIFQGFGLSYLFLHENPYLVVLAFLQNLAVNLVWISIKLLYWWGHIVFLIKDMEHNFISEISSFVLSFNKSIFIIESNFFSFVKSEACDPEIPVFGFVGKEKSFPLSDVEVLTNSFYDILIGLLYLLELFRAR